jgi:flavodoxin
MKTLIVSYSLSGNNAALADSLTNALNAEHITVTEPKHRSMGTIAFDVLLNRTPHVNPDHIDIAGYDLVIFVAPVWMGQVASPMRGYFKQIKNNIGNYAFVSISGGAEGPNPKLADELKARLGKEPVAFLNLFIADLIPHETKLEKKDTMGYHITGNDVATLTDKIVKALREKTGTATVVSES